MAGPGRVPSHSGRIIRSTGPVRMLALQRKGGLLKPFADPAKGAVLREGLARPSASQKKPRPPKKSRRAVKKRPRDVSLGIDRLHRVQKASDGGGGVGGVEQAVRDGVAPAHREGLEQGVNLPPVVDGHEDVLRILALVEHVDVEHLKIHDMDLGMVPPKLVPHLVQIVVPAPADEQKVFPVEILHSKALLGCQGVIDGHCAPYGLPNATQHGPQVFNLI